jgi:uncharacterized membrane protein
MKKQSMINMLVILFAISPVIYLLLTWNSVPETIVTRFEYGSTIEDKQGKEALMIATVAISAVSVLLYLLLRNLERVDPRVTESTPKSGFNRLGFIMCVFMTIGNFLFLWSIKNSATINVNVIFAGVGVLISIAGNYMNNLKPNYVAGIRLPWTLNDPENWRKTHHLAGKLWFLGGILIVIISIVAPGRLLTPLMIIVVLAISVIPGIYSYRIHRNRVHP